MEGKLKRKVAIKNLAACNYRRAVTDSNYVALYNYLSVSSCLVPGGIKLIFYVCIKYPLKDIYSIFFLLCAALLRAPRRPLPGCFAGPASQRPLPVRSEGRSGSHGGGGRRRPVPVFPSSPAHHSRAQLLALR